MTGGITSCGLLGLYRHLAESVVTDYGVDAGEREPALLAELETAMGEAALEASHQILREHGYGWALEGRQRPPTDSGSNPT